jgi:hypothetical protein
VSLTIISRNIIKKGHCKNSLNVTFHEFLTHVGSHHTWVARALDLVGGTDVAGVGLDALALLEEVAEDLVENGNIIKASGWVRTLDPCQVPPYNTYPNLVAEGGLPRVFVGGEPVPRLCLSCLRDPEIGPIDGHQAVVAHVI